MKKKLTCWAGVICWLLFLLLLISVSTHANWVPSLDQIGYQLTQPTTRVKTQIMIVLTHFGDPLIIQCLTVVIALGLWWKNHFNQSLWYVLMQFIGYALVILVKYNVLRPRPTHKLYPAAGYSFPSGHTFATVIFVFTLLALILPHCHHNGTKFIWELLGTIWIITIMVTRVYLRAHYTSDVIGGLLLASGWWLLMSTFRHQLSQWLIKPITKIHKY